MSKVYEHCQYCNEEFAGVRVQHVRNQRLRHEGQCSEKPMHTPRKKEPELGEALDTAWDALGGRPEDE